VSQLLKAVHDCRVCAHALPHEPRPVCAMSPHSRIVIIGQAPGAKVHASGVPWQDASGRKLREWLAVDDATFYDPDKFALIPMGFCYPGKGKSGDLPPRKECAPLWHERLFAEMKAPNLVILIGLYAQNYYLKDRGRSTLTENVRSFQEFLPTYLPLPHPSPRNRLWFIRNPWFQDEVLPELRARVKAELRPET
jgi:uracil-DNA glycosylase